MKYRIEEQQIERNKLENVRNAVLVEVDRIDDLKAAYPNYFLDVSLFMRAVGSLLA